MYFRIEGVIPSCAVRMSQTRQYGPLPGPGCLERMRLIHRHFVPV